MEHSNNKMINYVLRKVGNKVINTSQLYREKFEYALTNFDKVLQERKIHTLNQKFNR